MCLSCLVLFPILRFETQTRKPSGGCGTNTCVARFVFGATCILLPAGDLQRILVHLAFAVYMNRMVSSTESNESYKHMESPANAHSINMDFSNMTSAASRKCLEDSTVTYSKTMYDHDLVMIFPRREGGELKKPEDFTVSAFVELLLGKDRHKSKRQNKIVIDPFARVLRTTRCFLDDMGHDLVVDDGGNDHSDKAEQQRLIAEERILEGEYEKEIGSREPTTEALFCELVAKSIARRVQLACGLTTRLFRSCDNDEVCSAREVVFDSVPTAWTSIDTSFVFRFLPTDYHDHQSR